MKNTNQIRVTAFTILTITIALVTTPVAFSEPPVPDWSGSEGTTFQEWDFTDANTSPDPISDMLNNPNGDPLLTVYTDIEFGADGTSDGYWVLSGQQRPGQIDIKIPNYVNQNPYKEIWLTIVWNESEGYPVNPILPDRPIVGVAFEGMEYTDQYIEYEQEDSLGFGWKTSVYVLGLWPNPAEEWLNIKGNILVDSLSVETICIPEPATMTILALGGLCTVLRRKRKIS